MNYEKWTREALISKIIELQGPINKTKKTKKKEKVIDFSKSRHIALKVAYLGWNYSGVAMSYFGDNSVETKLFESLIQAKFIQSPENISFSRCGRTDKGVSALSQVFAFQIRSRSEDVENEYPYAKALNGILPFDIRVLGWVPVSPTFNARFDCTFRKYRYLLRSDGLDLEKMKEAAKYFVGVHDFRNFCQVTKDQCEKGFERTILDCSIEFSDDPSYFDFFVKGRGFLYHQVRCMVAVLELVGKGNESPDIVSELLNVEKYPSRPQYLWASEIPLILVDCGYDSITFPKTVDDAAVFRKWPDIIDKLYLQSKIMKIALDSSVDIFRSHFGIKHIPLKSRKFCGLTPPSKKVKLDEE